MCIKARVINLITNLLLKCGCIFLIGISPICAQQSQSRSRSSLPQEFQKPAQQPADSNATPETIIEPSEDYKIGTGDTIEVRIEDAPELSRIYRVSANGTILMPYIGSVKAENLTSDELSNEIINGLKGEYLADPNVAVSVKGINSHYFYVQGAVKRTGVYRIEGKPSVLKLITVAGGLTDNASSTAFVIKESKETDSEKQKMNDPDSGEKAEFNKSTEPSIKTNAIEQGGDSGGNADFARYELKKVNINGLLRGESNQNLLVEPGSIVNIPPADVFYVAGEVRAPGSFPLRDGTTLRQAISLAQGTTFEAKGRGIIYREDSSTGKRQEIQVDTAKVMSGQSDDVPLMANDIIMVPGNRTKSVASALARAFGLSVVRLPGRY
ncbi:MAG: polysaccharide biosynthesis/export family protein [Pyrinomonadaceae bacterium]